MTRQEKALEVVRAHYRLIGLAGPSVAHAEQIIDALDGAGMLRMPPKVPRLDQTLYEALRAALIARGWREDAGPQGGRRAVTSWRKNGTTAVSLNDAILKQLIEENGDN